MTSSPPFADDLILDEVVPAAPAVTLDAGLAASYLAITGDALPLALSDPLSAAVTGQSSRLANPGLVFTVAIGQSTVATGRVIANLRYEDVALLRPVHLGETLETRVVPVAAAWTRTGRQRAKVLLDISVRAGTDEVARFRRLALLPVAHPERLVERDLPAEASSAPLATFARLVPTWRAEPFPTRFAGAVGDSWTDPTRDTVSSARELVRLSLNLAAAHRDAESGSDGRRLVYGGHTIGLAQASLSRRIPGLLTVPAWRSCDHVAPVYEDDLLRTSVRIDGLHPLPGGLALVDARVEVDACRSEGDQRVLDWRPVLLVATEGTTR